MISLIKRIAYEMDLLKTPFSFYIDGKHNNSTIFGSFFSILIFFILYISFFQSNMIQKTNPYISEKILKYPASPNITINNITLISCLSDFYRECYMDKSIFSVEARIIEQNGGGPFKEKILDVKNCTKKDLDAKHLGEFNPDNIYCLNNDFVLYGNNNENILSVLFFSFRLCNNETDGIKCKGENEIINFLKDKYLMIGYSEYSIDMENYEQPYQQINKIMSVPVHIKSKDIHEINFKKVILKNDENWIYTDEKQVKDELFMSNSETTKNIDLLNIMNQNTINNPLIAFQFQSSNDVQISIRKYQKLQEVLANISGLANSLIFIGLIIIRIYIHLNLISIVNNSLSNFYIKYKEIKRKFSNSTINSKIKEKNIKIENIDTNHEFELKKTQTEKEIDNKKFFLDIFPDFFQYSIFCRNFKKPFLSIFEYLKIKLKHLLKRNLTKKEKLALEAENYYIERIDIVFILKKLQEIDYLKKILLSQQENELFFLLINEKNNSENSIKPKKNNYIDYLENYKLLLNKEIKSSINHNFLELLMKNLQIHDKLIKSE